MSLVAACFYDASRAKLHNHSETQRSIVDQWLMINISKVSATESISM